MEVPLAKLADQIGARLIGDASRSIRGVAGVDFATPNEITFMADAKYLSRLRTSNAGAVIVNACVEGLAAPQLVVDDVDAALLEVLSLFAPQYDICAEGVDATARIGKNVSLGRGVGIGPHVVVGDGVSIGDGTFVAAGCTIGQETRIGAACRLYPGVAIYENCLIGSHVVVQANAVIGSIGFGYTQINGGHRLVPHAGNVVVEDHVEIGANTCIDRAKFGSTRIGAGTKIDNLVQIAHNVTIGRCCLIAGMAGIAGSCRLGDGVVLGGGVGVRDHVVMGDGAMVGGKSFVIKDVAAGEKVFGFPAMPKIKALRVVHAMRRLPELSARVQKLEASLEEHQRSVIQKDRLKTQTARRMAAAVAAGMLIMVVLSVAIRASRTWLDPDEVRVENMVKSYQDGDDMFFVANDPRLEDLKTNDRLFLVGDIDQIIEQALAKYSDAGDCYFLVPLSSIDKLRVSDLRDRLFLVTEMAVHDNVYSLVTTESDRTFMGL
jgi:UDP-3-O-[3-hydroxymyristoyl] glucosamine N-acyltransferase